MESIGSKELDSKTCASQIPPPSSSPAAAAGYAKREAVEERERLARELKDRLHPLKMLHGIKFIPRDQLLSAVNNNTDGGDSEEEEMKSNKKKGERRGKKRMEESKKKKRSKRKEYSSKDGTNSGSLYSESSSSWSEDKEGASKTKRKRKNKDSSDDDGGRNNEIARKKMGLEWMLRSGSRPEKAHVAKVSLELEEPQAKEEVTLTNPRELNPYLRDNGSGYPNDASSPIAAAGQLLSSSVVGDGGASWRLKALKRAKEQAAREGRKLDEVVEERWGSLGHLAASVVTRKAAPAHAHLRAIKDRKMGQIETPETKADEAVKEGVEASVRGSHAYLRDVSSKHPGMRKPKHDSLHWKSKRHTLSSEDSSLISSAISVLNKFSSDGSFMDRFQSKSADDSTCSPRASTELTNCKKNDIAVSEVCSVNTQGLNANQLAAKVLQLRMKGKIAEAEKLSKEMESMTDLLSVGKKWINQETEGSRNRFIQTQISSEKKRREEDVDLHLAQKIMHSKQYSLSGRADEEYDFDGDAPSKKRSQQREPGNVEKIGFSKRMLTQQERCQFCFENPSRSKHLVVSIGNFTYMMLPRWQAVVRGHCCILPMQHESASRTVDKNVWEEIRNFKKCLLRMFAAQDKDVVFIETVVDLERQRRHCLIECIPLPHEVANLAPMYFKKAIDEAEDEWGQHEMKKVIPTSGNLHYLIPENLSYFHVEFGLDRGFVHVIDNDVNFSSNFGLNVIRGILQLPEEDMHRRRQQEPIEKQRKAATSFFKEWEPFDWTRDL